MLEFGRVDYGSALRDAAALVSLASEGNAPRATLTQAVERVEVARGLTPYTSTQENAWLVLASRALAKETHARSISTARRSRPRSIAATRPPRWRASRSRSPTPATRRCRRWSRSSGSPVTPEPAASNGFKIERNYFTLDGKPADVAKAKQNDRFAVVLKITEAKPEYGHIMVSDYLPAGLEIDNPHLVSSGDTGTLDWIEDGEEPENTEFRDDRFTAAIDRAADDKSVFTVAYVVRAVSPGKYVLPQAYVEDMYNPSRYGRTGTGIGRGASGEMSEATNLPSIVMPGLPSIDAATVWQRLDGRDKPGHDGDERRIARVAAAASHRLRRGRLRRVGRLARAVAADAGPPGLHHDRRPQRQAAARLCDGRRPLAAAGRCEDRRRSRPISNCCWPMKTGASASHAGVDPLALGRAALQLVTRGHIVSGGSTITMQLARLMEPRRQRSVYAKLRQMVRALEIERQLTRTRSSICIWRWRRIGGNLEGIRAASIAYFGKEPKRLSLAEAALLVALPQSPETRRLDRYPDAARAARDRVLDRMVEEGRGVAGGRDAGQGRAGAAAAQADADPGAAFRRSGDRDREGRAGHQADAGCEPAEGARSAGARPRDRAGAEYLGRASSRSTMRAATCWRGSARPIISTTGAPGRST